MGWCLGVGGGGGMSNKKKKNQVAKAQGGKADT